MKKQKIRKYCYALFVLSIITLLIKTMIFTAPQTAFNNFLNNDYVFGNQIADPLILASDNVIPLVINHINSNPNAKKDATP